MHLHIKYPCGFSSQLYEDYLVVLADLIRSRNNTQYVRRHVEFASVTDKEIIENVQKKAVKMISGLAGNTYEEKCKELGLESLEARRNKQDLLQTYKIFNGKDRIKQEVLFTTAGENTARHTRFTTDPVNIVEKRYKKILIFGPSSGILEQIKPRG